MFLRKMTIFLCAILGTFHWGSFTNVYGNGEFIADTTLSNQISFRDANGTKRNLKDFRGRPIIVAVWATWCVPCIKEIPALDRLQKNNPDMQIIPLSIDRGGVKKVEDF